MTEIGLVIDRVWGWGLIVEGRGGIFCNGVSVLCVDCSGSYLVVYIFYNLLNRIF